MCFSAGASFGAAAVLGAGGAVILSKAKSPSQRMFAAMPVLFAVQQVTEGFEWLSFNNPAFEHFRTPMMYAFLFFAQILWPSWVPISIWKIEPDPAKRKMLGVLSFLGLICSALLAYRMIYFPVVSDIEGHHIRYSIDSPQWMVIVSSIFYIVSTLVSPLGSSLKNMKIVGLLMLIALVVTQLFYTQYLVSVWCFFSALLSIAILLVIQSAPDRSYLHSILHNRINPDKIDW